MYDKILIQDMYGQHYVIQNYSTHLRFKGNLKPKVFSGHYLARQFVQGLKVPSGYWQGLMRDIGHHDGYMLSEAVAINAACDAIACGQFAVFAVNPPGHASGSPQKRIIQTKDKIYHFIPAVEQLLSNTETKNFNSKEEAKAFLAKLNADEEQLKGMASELEVDVPANASPAQVNEAISESLASGNTAVTEQTTASATSPTMIEAAVAVVAQQASLGPETEATKKTEKKVEHDCIYQKLTLTCRHGRSITLDPSVLPKEGTVPTFQIVSSQNEELKGANGKPVFDILEVAANITDVCPSHETNFITLSDPDAKFINTQSGGKQAKFKSPSKQINVGTGSGVLKYLWLPNVESEGVKRYKVHTVKSCDFSEFSGKGKSIQVEVFPHMKWSLNFNVNLGSIKNDSKPSQNKMAFEGSLKLQQDDAEAAEFTADYKKKLEVFEDTLDNFKKILNDNIFDRFKEGRDIEIDVTLPKIALTYDTRFKEKPGSPLVVRTHEFAFQADPFVKIAASVDILPVIVKFLSSWWSSLFNVFFDWVKQKFGSEEGRAHIESNIFFKLSISGGMGGKFAHEQGESGDPKLTGQPLTTKIIIKAEGEAKLDGHVYVVKVAVVLKAGLESSIDMGLRIDNDEGAPYMSLDFMFNGIMLYLEKEMQFALEKNTKDTNSFSKGLFGEIVDEALSEGEEIGTKEIKRSEPRVWLKMSDKHQFKYYLKEEDRLKIQSQK